MCDSRLLLRKETSLSQEPLEKIFSAQRTITEQRNNTQSTMKRVTVDNEKSTIFQLVERSFISDLHD